MHKFLEIPKLPKLVPEEIESLCCLKSTRDFEVVIKTFPQRKIKSLEVNYIKHLWEKQYQSYINRFGRVGRKDQVTIHFMRSSLSSYQHQNFTRKKKLRTNVLHERRYKMSFKNQQKKSRKNKRVIYYIQVAFIPGMQV